MELKKVRAIDLAKSLQTTPQNLQKIFNKENLGTEVIVKVAEALNIPITSFFNETIGEHVESELEVLKREIELLKSVIEAQNTTISVLKKKAMIEV